MTNSCEKYGLSNVITSTMPRPENLQLMLRLWRLFNDDDDYYDDVDGICGDGGDHDGDQTDHDGDHDGDDHDGPSGLTVIS